MNSDYRSNLEKAFGFTEADLYDNRQGRLAPSQAARLRGHSLRIFLAIVAFLAFVTIPAFLIMDSTPQELTVVLACTILPVVAFTFAFTVAVTEAAVAPRVVSQLSGQIHLGYGVMGYNPPLDNEQVRFARTVFMARAASYRMVISNREFRLSRDEFEALAVGYYSVYFLPSMNKIVAIQRIDPDFKEQSRKSDIVVTALPPGEDIEEVRG